LTGSKVGVRVRCGVMVKDTGAISRV